MATGETALPNGVNICCFINIVAINRNSCVIMNIVANEGRDIFSTCVFNNIVANREKNGAPFFICSRGGAEGNSLIFKYLALGRFVSESRK